MSGSQNNATGDLAELGVVIKSDSVEQANLRLMDFQRQSGNTVRSSRDLTSATSDLGRATEQMSRATQAAVAEMVRANPQYRELIKYTNELQVAQTKLRLEQGLFMTSLRSVNAELQNITLGFRGASEQLSTQYQRLNMLAGMLGTTAVQYRELAAASANVTKNLAEQENITRRFAEAYSGRGQAGMAAQQRLIDYIGPIGNRTTDQAMSDFINRLKSVRDITLATSDAMTVLGATSLETIRNLQTLGNAALTPVQRMRIELQDLYARRNTLFAEDIKKMNEGPSFWSRMATGAYSTADSASGGAITGAYNFAGTAPDRLALQMQNWGYQRARRDAELSNSMFGQAWQAASMTIPGMQANYSVGAFMNRWGGGTWDWMMGRALPQQQYNPNAWLNSVGVQGAGAAARMGASFSPELAGLAAMAQGRDSLVQFRTQFPDVANRLLSFPSYSGSQPNFTLDQYYQQSINRNFRDTMGSPYSDFRFRTGITNQIDLSVIQAFNRTTDAATGANYSRQAESITAVAQAASMGQAAVAALNTQFAQSEMLREYTNSLGQVAAGFGQVVSARTRLIQEQGLAPFVSAVGGQLYAAQSQGRMLELSQQYGGQYNPGAQAQAQAQFTFETAVDALNRLGPSPYSTAYRIRFDNLQADRDNTFRLINENTTRQTGINFNGLMNGLSMQGAAGAYAGGAFGSVAQMLRQGNISAAQMVTQASPGFFMDNGVFNPDRYQQFLTGSQMSGAFADQAMIIRNMFERNTQNDIQNMYRQQNIQANIQLMQGQASAFGPGAVRWAGILGGDMGTGTDFLSQVAGIESGGDPFARNRRSSATGLFQFIDSTWLDQLSRSPMAGQFAGMSRDQLLALRNDPNLSRMLAAQYLRTDIAPGLASAGFDTTNANLYAGLHFGRGGAVQLLRTLQSNPTATFESVFGANSRVMQANPTLMGRSVAGWFTDQNNRFQNTAPFSTALMQGQAAEAGMVGGMQFQAGQNNDLASQMLRLADNAGLTARRLAEVRSNSEAAAQMLGTDYAQATVAAAMAQERLNMANQAIDLRYQIDSYAEFARILGGNVANVDAATQAMQRYSMAARAGLSTDSPEVAQMMRLQSQSALGRQIVEMTNSTRTAQDRLGFSQLEYETFGMPERDRQRVLQLAQADMQFQAQVRGLARPNEGDVEGQSIYNRQLTELTAMYNQQRSLISATAQYQGMLQDAQREQELLLEPVKNAIRGTQSMMTQMYVGILSGGKAAFSDLGAYIKQTFIQVGAEMMSAMTVRPFMGALAGAAGMSPSQLGLPSGSGVWSQLFGGDPFSSNTSTGGGGMMLVPQENGLLMPIPMSGGGGGVTISGGVAGTGSILNSSGAGLSSSAFATSANRQRANQPLGLSALLSYAPALASIGGRAAGIPYMGMLGGLFGARELMNLNTGGAGLLSWQGLNTAGGNMFAKSTFLDQAFPSLFGNGAAETAGQAGASVGALGMTGAQALSGIGALAGVANFAMNPGIGSGLGAAGGIMSAMAAFNLIAPAFGPIGMAIGAAGAILGPMLDKQKKGFSGAHSQFKLDSSGKLVFDGAYGKKFDLGAVSQQGQDYINSINQANSQLGLRFNADTFGGSRVMLYGDATKYYDASTAMPTDYVDMARRGFLADPNSPELTSALRSANYGNADELNNMVTFFRGIYTAAKEVNPVLNEMGKRMKDMRDEFNDVMKQATTFGLSTAGIPEGYRGRFNQDVGRMIKQMEDPFGFALGEFDTAADEMRKTAMELGADMVAVEKYIGLQRKKIIDDFGAEANAKLQQTLSMFGQAFKSFTIGTAAGASTQSRYNAALLTYGSIQSKLAGKPGDQDLLQKYSVAGSDLVSVARDLFAESPQFAAVYQRVLKDFLTAAPNADGADAAKAMLDQLTQGYGTSTLDIQQVLSSVSPAGVGAAKPNASTDTGAAALIASSNLGKDLAAGLAPGLNTLATLMNTTNTILSDILIEQRNTNSYIKTVINRSAIGAAGALV